MFPDLNLYQSLIIRLWLSNSTHGCLVSSASRSLTFHVCIPWFNPWCWTVGWQGLLSQKAWTFTASDTHPYFPHQFRPYVSTKTGEYRQCTNESCMYSLGHCQFNVYSFTPENILKSNNNTFKLTLRETLALFSMRHCTESISG